MSLSLVDRPRNNIRYELTKSRNVPNAKQNKSGPARSVSSMILRSTGRRGFRTVNDFVLM